MVFAFLVRQIVEYCFPQIYGAVWLKARLMRQRALLLGIESQFYKRLNSNSRTRELKFVREGDLFSEVSVASSTVLWPQTIQQKHDFP